MINIDSDLLDVLVGSLLGRGCLQGEADAPHYREKRDPEFTPYLKWKQEQWGPSAWVEDGQLRTVPSKALAAWYYLFYSSGTLRVPLTVDRFMTVGALAVWFLDRCTALSYTSGWPYLLLKAVDDQSVEKIKQVLQGFGLRPRYKPPHGSRKEWEIEFKGDQGAEAAKFLTLISPYVPSCMQRMLDNYNIVWHHRKWLQQTLSERFVIKHLLGLYKEENDIGRTQFELELMVRAGVPPDHMARLLRMSIYDVKERLKESGITRFRHSEGWQGRYIQAVREMSFG